MFSPKIISRFFFSKKIISIFYFFNFQFIFFTKILIAIHGARVPGSVFKMTFRGLARGFESFWDLSRICQASRGKLSLKSEKINNQKYVGKRLSNDKILEVNVAISQKNLCCMIFEKENDREWNELKTWELTVCTHTLFRLHILWSASLDLKLLSSFKE